MTERASMLKTEKVLQLKNKQGRPMRVVREHYLRKDVPCNSEFCQHCPPSPKSKLGRCYNHYLVPDGRTSRDFLDILELPELGGIVILDTVLHFVKHNGSRRLLNRLRGRVNDNSGSCVVFANEFCLGAFSARESEESEEQWQTRLVYDAAVWYYHHLDEQIPIIVLTSDQSVLEKCGSKTMNVHVMSMEQYLNLFWPDVTQAQDILESVKASLIAAAESEDGSKEYVDHVNSEKLMVGTKSGRFIEGTLRVSKHHSQQEAFLQRKESVSTDVQMHSDILISGIKNRNRAVHGDSVVVELLPREQWTGRIVALKSGDESQEEKGDVYPCGRVIGILERNWRDYVATFPEQNGVSNRGGKVLVIPWDYRIPKIRISTRQAETLRNHRILVRIDNWPADSQYPNGHFVRALGPIGQLETEVAAILIENRISVGPFSEGIMKEMPTNSPESPWQMSAEEVARRRDLRHSHLVFSIDPKGCEDVDDTLSIRELDNDHIELGVHIADVSYFVHQGSLTDQEARQRATTVYLADRRYDMLPAILSADLCSLVGGVDRYAVSVLWVLKQSNYEVVKEKVWYGRTIIRSAYKMFYEAAQMLHDGKELSPDDIPELKGMDEVTKNLELERLKWAIDNLMAIARHLKARREVGGAIQLDGTEVKVELNEEQEIENLVPKQTMEIHETIAECMIFANHWVARKIAQVFPDAALLRRHPLPRQDQFQDLIGCAKSKGFAVDTSSNKKLAESLDKCVDVKDPTFNRILRSLATKAMSNALYFSTGSEDVNQFFHYGLALDRYTHFTSPIRRYADVIVHRLLLAAVEKVSEEDTLLSSNQELQMLCGHLNRQNRAAQNAQRDSQELFQALFFQDKDPSHEACIVDAVIQNLRANGFLVFIPRYGIKGAVYLRDKEGLVCDSSLPMKPRWMKGSLARSEHSVAVQAAGSQAVFRLFDHVTVGVSIQTSRAHPHTLRLELLANCPFHQGTGPAGTEEGSTLQTNIVQEVRQWSEDSPLNSLVTLKDDVEVLGSSLKTLKRQYGQSSEGASLYHMLQRFRTMDLQADGDL
ncbi:DIS3-like exonuclease 1 [Diadema antillarum]|uniref:DIS3-like exonuclease 1 n=1 Tax=Diadema antillarum TaxID=105358 RepID=UPI003A892012